MHRDRTTATSSTPPVPEKPESASTAAQSLGGSSYMEQTELLSPGGVNPLAPQGLPGPVQTRGGTADAATTHAAAAEGLQERASTLPHLEQIQRSCGAHDLSHVEAHVGGKAADATQKMGAEAYATGDHVAFGAAPDLHTAAHEAAHVVQQRSGVHLSEGVGSSGDRYEQHADAVADAVVRGDSAEPLLGPVGENAEASATVQQMNGGKEFGEAFFKLIPMVTKIHAGANHSVCFLESASDFAKKPPRALKGLKKFSGKLRKGANAFGNLADLTEEPAAFCQKILNTKETYESVVNKVNELCISTQKIIDLPFDFEDLEAEPEKALEGYRAYFEVCSWGCDLLGLKGLGKALSIIPTAVEGMHAIFVLHHQRVHNEGYISGNLGRERSREAHALGGSDPAATVIVRTGVDPLTRRAATPARVAWARAQL